jgi:hypothetical protein
VYDNGIKKRKFGEGVGEERGLVLLGPAQEKGPTQVTVIFFPFSLVFYFLFLFFCFICMYI